MVSLGALFFLPAAASGAGGTVRTIPTIKELRTVQGTPDSAVLLLGYHAAGDSGGGLFSWQADCVRQDDGGTVIAAGDLAEGRWIRRADDIKVTYFGARGDGVADDTAAIQSAINAVSETAAPGTAYEEARKVGGTVHFPAGKYRVSDTLLVGPQTTLQGVGSVGGFQRGGLLANDRGSVIVARFDDPKKWIVSTAVYYRGGEDHGRLIPYRTMVGGRGYDGGGISRADGVVIRNLLLTGENNADGEPPYGGIRLQACPGSLLQGVGVHGVDVAFMLNVGWGLAMRDCSSVSNLYGLLVLHDVNGLAVDNCYINGNRTGRTIDESNVAPGELSDRGAAGGMPADYPYKTAGILTHYGHNVTLNNVITEHWDIARFHIQGLISDTGSWIEGNRELGYALVSADLDLRNPYIFNPPMIREGRFLRAGTNVRAVIGQSPAFPISYGVWAGASPNRIAVQAADPDLQGWHDYPLAVTYGNRIPGLVRVAADDDEAVDNNRIADTTSYVDLATALERIGRSRHRDWTIVLKDGANIDLPRQIDLPGKTIRFEQNGATLKTLAGPAAGTPGALPR